MPTALQNVLWIAAAGALGSVSRYGLTLLVQRWAGTGFPWGTLAVNGLGCLLFGLIWHAAAERMLLGSEARLIVLVGFMGAFTTFSTFAFDTAELARQSHWWLAAANLLAQNALGLAAVFVGAAIGKWIGP